MYRWSAAYMLLQPSLPVAAAKRSFSRLCLSLVFCRGFSCPFRRNSLSGFLFYPFALLDCLSFCLSESLKSMLLLVCLFWRNPEGLSGDRVLWECIERVLYPVASVGGSCGSYHHVNYHPGKVVARLCLPQRDYLPAGRGKKLWCSAQWGLRSSTGVESHSSSWGWWCCSASMAGGPSVFDSSTSTSIVPVDGEVSLLRGFFLDPQSPVSMGKELPVSRAPAKSFCWSCPLEKGDWERCLSVCANRLAQVARVASGSTVPLSAPCVGCCSHSAQAAGSALCYHWAIAHTGTEMACRCLRSLGGSGWAVAG